jgi:hypothetical protein
MPAMVRSVAGSKRVEASSHRRSMSAAVASPGTDRGTARVLCARLRAGDRGAQSWCPSPAHPGSLWTSPTAAVPVVCEARELRRWGNDRSDGRDRLGCPLRASLALTGNRCPRRALYTRRRTRRPRGLSRSTAWRRSGDSGMPAAAAPTSGSGRSARSWRSTHRSRSCEWPWTTTTGQRWRDLWVLTLDGSGRCERFEEWPFAANQSDGHEADR